MSQFNTPHFLTSSNIYSVNMRQFTEAGTFNAFAEHLPRLKDMGVDILWLMPIHPIGITNRKGTLGSYYSIKDFRDVNPEYGNKYDFKQLIERTHALGMKVILDWVANHAAWDNVWTIDHPDFFEQDETGRFKPPYDWEDVIQLNHQHPLQQQTMIDAMKYWIVDFDIDGFRADLAHLTPLPFWINARQQITSLKKDLIWLAETEDIPYHQAFDISFTWQWMHASEAYCKGQKSFQDLLQTLAHYKIDFPEKALRMYFTSNHDENSWNSTAYEKYGINVKALSVFNATWYGIPMIYSGEEAGLNKRLFFFDKDPINWEVNPSLHGFYKTLLQVRKENCAISAGYKSFPMLLEDAIQHQLLAYSRKTDEALILVFLNISPNHINCTLHTEYLSGNYSNVFTNEEMYIGQLMEINLAPGDFILLQKIK
ncbi:MAG: alpha-amylase family glycosyl hydrolase [Ferruginibacter sp.]